MSRAPGEGPPGRVVECVPNVSEGRDRALLERFATAIRAAHGVTLADLHADPDHHRAVFTFLGDPDGVEAAALALAAEVLHALDMRRHRGVHPRVGALDVLPFVPLAGVGMAETVELARRVGRTLAARHDVPVYFYGFAAIREARRSLPELRVGGYEGLAERLGTPVGEPDTGPPRFAPRSGAVLVGARGVLVAFNAWLESNDVDAARAIARAIRESSGGLPAVQAVGLPLASQGIVQVAMNLLDYRRTPIPRVWDRLREEASRRGITVRRGELVGLAPRAALAGRPPESVGLDDLTPERYLESYLTGPLA